MIKDYMPLILSLILGILLLSPLPSLARQLTSIELIERAYRSGEIDYKEALNYRVAAVLRPENLPEGYRSKVPVKSATPVMMEARSNQRLLSPENARFLARGMARSLTEYYGSGVTLLSYASPDRHFRVHYTTTGFDAVPPADNNGNRIPDYVEEMAGILDHVWDEEINNLGYNAPPSDGAEGGDCLLDVYLADLGAYGFTQIDEGALTSTVYMIFENDFDLASQNTDPDGAQAGAMKVTAAHEFFHTIQFQITDDIAKYGWWMEASATWMEERIYPEVNDYINYIDYWFEHPELSIDTSDGLFEYGTSVWVNHLTEKYGSKFVYDVWNRINGGETALSAIENSLTERGTTLAEALKEMRVANLTFTYEDGQLYQTWDPTNPIEVPYTQAQDGIVNGTVDPLSAAYYAFYAPGGPRALNIDFVEGGNSSVTVMGVRQDGYDLTEIDLINNTGSLIVNGFSNNGPYKLVVVILSNDSPVNQDSFTLTAAYTTTLPANAATIELQPSSASLVTNDGGVAGRQQYSVILKDMSGNQVLENGINWASDPTSLDIDSNGFATALQAVTHVLITGVLGSLTGNASLSADNPVMMMAGTPRNCTIKSGDSRCFIATAAFGSPLHPYVEILREFRDRYLVTNSPGRNMVSLYYLYSPPIAEQIEDRVILKTLVKLFLIPVIILAELMVKTTVTEEVIIGFVVLMFVIAGWSRRCHERSLD
ncbi:MAG: hypothetical protein HZA18_03690 [Nitrospirae bacterium]|nr:hypothetical protein [Nitrospirota bacterium]